MLNSRKSSSSIKSSILILCSEKWGIPTLSLSTYLQFWGVMCYIITLWLLFFKKEVRRAHNCLNSPNLFQDKEPANEADMSISGVYKTIWSICKLKRRSPYSSKDRRHSWTAGRHSISRRYALLCETRICGERCSDIVEDGRERIQEGRTRGRGPNRFPLPNHRRVVSSEMVARRPPTPTLGLRVSPSSSLLPGRNADRVLVPGTSDLNFLFHLPNYPNCASLILEHGAVRGYLRLPHTRVRPSHWWHIYDCELNLRLIVLY